ncbi:MlaD family protein [Mycolicibacterium septicum]|uniref:MlaD family protein n=1 Tax=Mycolicibacterium septicum TaxID=98668 RepID=UPI002362293A|nr:MlaD family protein [Mycolicibacterium septicum]
MRFRDFVSFFAFVVIVVLGVVYVGSLGIRAGPPSDRANVSMTVPETNGLVPDSNVLLRGVPVGKVSGIETSGDGATVNFYIDGRFKIPMDSEVRLENLSALGETYIGLFPRVASGPILHDGLRIDTESVVQPPSISELATSVVRVLDQLDPEALKRITNEADTALPDPNTVLPNLVRASTLLNDTAKSMNGVGQQNLTNFQTLLRNANWLGPMVADVSPRINALAWGLKEYPLSGLPPWLDVARPEDEYNFHHFFDRIQRLLDNNGGDLKVLGDALQPHFNAIAGALMNYDPSQILANVLASVPEDGAITLRVKAPDN